MEKLEAEVNKANKSQAHENFELIFGKICKEILEEGIFLVENSER